MCVWGGGGLTALFRGKLIDRVSTWLSQLCMPSLWACVCLQGEGKNKRSPVVTCIGFHLFFPRLLSLTPVYGSATTYPQTQQLANTVLFVCHISVIPTPHATLFNNSIQDSPS